MAKKAEKKKPDGLTGKRISGVKALFVGSTIRVTPDHTATVIGKSETATGFKVDIRVDTGWETSLYTTSDGWVFEAAQPPLQSQPLEPAYG